MRAAALEFLRSPRTTAALTTAGAGLIAIAFTVQQLAGWPGFIAALVLLDVLLVASLVARRDEIDWSWTMIPLSLVAFTAWAVVSVFWSDYQGITLRSVAYLGLVTLVGVFIGLSRDTIQIIRAMGDVLRAVLLASLVIEVLAGIIFDAPLRVLDIRGDLGDGGPISGLVATRNQLGLLAVIAVVTFVIEWRTRTITRQLAIASVSLALATIVFTKSPAVGMVAVVVFAATAVLYGIRRLPAGRRQIAQYGVLAVLAIAAVLAWAFRGPIIGLFNANGELALRLEIWGNIQTFAALHWLEGWGWAGIWNAAVPPYSVLTPTQDRPHDSALNAIADVWLQLGAVGVGLFLALVGLAFTRSWLLAGRRRSVVHTWPALVLVALIVVSLSESAILTEFGWLLLVICCVKASADLSWRRALSAIPPSADDTGAIRLPTTRPPSG